MLKFKIVVGVMCAVMISLAAAPSYAKAKQNSCGCTQCFCDRPVNQCGGK